jgi:restriction system protein
MSIPDYQSLMLPLLKIASDGKEHRIRDGIELLANELGLSEDDQSQLLPSGKQTVFSSRVRWSKTYLTQAQLLQSPKRAHFQITDRGRKVLEERPSKINLEYLMQFKEFIEFRDRRLDDSQNAAELPQSASAVPVSRTLDEISTTLTLDEMLQSAAKGLEDNLAKELRDRILKEDDKFFEQPVVDLLKTVFTGTHGRVTGKKGDRGIDGIILQDRFGLDRIYCQAKRYADTPVPRRDVSSFCNDIGVAKGTKGVFVTASRFTSDARQCADNHSAHNVILIDGDQLVKLMIEHNVGVRTEDTIYLKKIDGEYFSEEE